MNILFVSNDLIGGNLARILTNEGHNVKLYVADKKRRNNLKNLVAQTDNWKKELKWVGKGENGLIVFDDVGYGKVQDKLRKQGYSVFGGSELGDKLETNRQFGKEVFAHYGMNTVPLINIDGVSDAINFVKRHPGAWVIKQNGHSAKSFSYVGMFNDGRDVLDMLENYQEKTKYKHEVITLQQKLTGVEIGAGRYFNGTDWVGPIEINLEHKKLFPGDLGPTTSEMGTLAWYDNNENNKLFQETLAKLKPFLQEINFRGDFEINCIVNEEGAFPLEATARFGSPIIHLHAEIHKSPWGDFLKAVADGKSYDLDYKKGFGLVVLATVPPFPYAARSEKNSLLDMNIYFDKKVMDNFEHIHFEDASVRDKDRNQYYISDSRGYILYATGMGKDVQTAMANTYNTLAGVHIPKMFYRNDIGLKFIQEDAIKLKKWGYL